MLGAFILLFVGAGIFDIADGAPLTPLQILSINFAIDVILAVGLGFDAAARGLMRRMPRNAAAAIVDRWLGIRLSIASVVMAALALGIVAWGEHRYDLVVATTMGLTTLSLMHIAGALECREPTGTIFTRYTIANRRFVQLIGLTLVLAFLVTGQPVAADLRHGLADELAVGRLPARPARLPRGGGAGEALRPAQRRRGARCAGDRRFVTDGRPAFEVSDERIPDHAERLVTRPVGLRDLALVFRRPRRRRPSARGGRELLPADARGHRRARSSVHINQFGFRPGASGSGSRMRWSPRPPKVCRCGSSSTAGLRSRGRRRDLYERLRAGGVEVRVVRAMQARTRAGVGRKRPALELHGLGHIDHRKVVVVDGRSAGSAAQGSRITSRTAASTISSCA